MAGSFRQQLLDDFDRDLEAGAAAMTARYVELVRADGATPKASGALADGIKADQPVVRPGQITTAVRSTRKSETGADVGTILDRSTGRLVEAASYGHAAFGPIDGGDPEFIRSFRVTTKHVGWWEKATRVEHARTASQQLARFDL